MDDSSLSWFSRLHFCVFHRASGENELCQVSSLINTYSWEEKWKNRFFNFSRRMLDSYQLKVALKMQITMFRLLSAGAERGGKWGTYSQAITEREMRAQSVRWRRRGSFPASLSVPRLRLAVVFSPTPYSFSDCHTSIASTRSSGYLLLLFST